jgi:Uncharacterized conserved protein
MLKTKVGHSINTNSFESGVETATNSKAKNTKLGMLYTSVELDQKEIIKGVKSVLPDTQIIGCTSCGAIIVPEGYIDNAEGFSGMMTFSDEKLTVGVGGSERGENPRETGRKIAKEALKKAGLKKVPNYFYMVASPGEEELYLKGIEDVIGRVPFFGGSAADNTVEGKWSIFANDKIFSDGCAVAFFYDNGKFVNEYTGEYEETTKSGIITKIEGRKLIEINNKPALDVYSEWTGKPIDSLIGGNLLVETICAPLGVKDPLGDLIVIRHPMNGNEDKSMDIGNNLATNTAITLMDGNPNELVRETKDVLERVNGNLPNPAGYFLVHCGGRKIAIVDRMEEVYNNIKSEAGDTPFLTIFTFGEYGSHEHSKNSCGGLMLSFTGFSK